MVKIVTSSKGVMNWRKKGRSSYECDHCGGVMDFKYLYCGFCGRQALNADIRDLDFDEEDDEEVL